MSAYHLYYIEPLENGDFSDESVGIFLREGDPFEELHKREEEREKFGITEKMVPRLWKLSDQESTLLYPFAHKTQ